MNCIITDKPTKSKMKGYPMSREGRDKVRAYLDKVENLARDTGMPFKCTTINAIRDIREGYDLVEDHKKTLARISEDEKCSI